MYKEKTQEWMRHLDFIVIDLLMLLLAFGLAYLTRYDLHIQNKDIYVSLALLLLLLDFAVMVIGGTTRGVMYRGYYRELAVTAKHVALVLLLCMMYLFLVKDSETYSRLVIGYFGCYYFVLAYAARQVWKSFLKRTPDKNKNAIYVITTKDRAADVVERYQTREVSQYRLTGVCLVDADEVGTDILGVPVTSNAETVLQFLCREWVDEVVLSIPERDKVADDLMSKLAEMGIVVHMEMEGFAELGWQRQEVEKLAGRTVLTIGMNMATPAQLLLKRGMDIVGGLVGCLITAVLTVFIGPLIYIQSPGPIFFAQTRVGKNGKLFKMYKFRSMYLDAEARKAELMAENRVGGGLMFKLDFDPRIIGSKKLSDGTVKKGIGNFIRDWSLDEFPQFWNVLKGDLSLVGTRPPTVDEWDRYELHHRARLAAKPGITGMWQVSGRSKITDFEQVVALDKKYIQEWSMGLDLRILLQTVLVVLRRDGSM
ncbi:MAG: sugar transferase [Eubacteriales bacterium]|nr:sugar transferase [Eubacteriales bacterium]